MMFKLIRRLNISHKLMLVSMSFLIPDCVLLCLFLVTINGYINFAQQERNGNEYLRPLEDLLVYLPQHLELTQRRASGDMQSAKQLPEVQAGIDAAFGRLTAIDARLGESLQFTDEGLAQQHREGCRAAIVAQEWKKLK